MTAVVVEHLVWARRERLREFVERFDRADDVDAESQVDLALELLRRAAALRAEVGVG